MPEAACVRRLNGQMTSDRVGDLEIYSNRPALALSRLNLCPGLGQDQLCVIQIKWPESNLTPEIEWMQHTSQGLDNDSVSVYAGAALVTVGFQIYVRSEKCFGYRACAVSLAKGAVWSAIWPVLWPVYLAGA